MSRPLWFVELLKRAFPHRVWLAKVTRLSVLDRIFERWLFEGDDMVYLPPDRSVRPVPEAVSASEKGRVISIGQSLEPPKETVLPSQVVEHFIDRAKVHWVMDFCICRDAAGCEDYPVELGCLFLGPAALDINPNFGRRVTREQARAHVQRCREAGLVHLIGRNKLDPLWLGVGPGDRLLTICNCCPCCCLWRVLPYVADRISAKVSRMPGVTVAVSDRCAGCGVCTRGVCFVDAIHVVDGRAVIRESCRGCGRCAAACPHDAIEILVQDDQFVARSIARLSALVDLS